MRNAVVAGSFYEGSEGSLRKQIEQCFLHRVGPGTLPEKRGVERRHVLGLVSPHAGYAYSGPVAAHGFLQVALEEPPEVVVILGPNHRGIGSGIALSAQDMWETPLGCVETDKSTGERIIPAVHGARWDDTAHGLEHSLEVQLPFLQYIFGCGFKIVPIAMMWQDLATSRNVGEAVAAAIEGKQGLIIASSDFTHYESHAVATKKDNLALEAIINMDGKQLERVVMAHDISMCGPGPIVAMLTACETLGANKPALLKYATVGDITGDYSRVVGYASVEVAC